MQGEKSVLDLCKVVGEGPIQEERAELGLHNVVGKMPL